MHNYRAGNFSIFNSPRLANSPILRISDSPILFDENLPTLIDIGRHWRGYSIGTDSIGGRYCHAPQVVGSTVDSGQHFPLSDSTSTGNSSARDPIWRVTPFEYLAGSYYSLLFNAICCYSLLFTDICFYASVFRCKARRDEQSKGQEQRIRAEEKSSTCKSTFDKQCKCNAN